MEMESRFCCEVSIGNVRLFTHGGSVFYGERLQDIIRPGVSDEIGGVIPTGHDIDLEGNQRIPQPSGGRGCSDYDDGQFSCKGIRI